jgi:hypothetical protein
MNISAGHYAILLATMLKMVKFQTTGNGLAEWSKILVLTTRKIILISEDSPDSTFRKRILNENRIIKITS